MAQSFASSLEHLGTDYIDSYVLHGPTRRVGLAPADWEAWCAMEAIHTSGRARLLGVSNVSLNNWIYCAGRARAATLRAESLFCRARLGSRRGGFCAANQIIYQGFSLLTANGEALAHPACGDCPASWPLDHSNRVSVRAGRGHVAADRDHEPEHMRTDLDVFDFHLNKDEIECIETLVAA